MVKRDGVVFGCCSVVGSECTAAACGRPGAVATSATLAKSQPQHESMDYNDVLTCDSCAETLEEDGS